MIRILLAEDETHLQEAITLNLEIEGYEVVAVSSGNEALKCFESERFDLVILDVMLPEVDGFTICQSIRLQNQDIPILFLTAKNASVDRIHGLKLGADDYLTKPFNLEELLLRIKNLLRRIETIEEKVENDKYSFGDNWVHFRNFEIKGVDGTTRQLSQKEIKLLKFLIDRSNQVVSRQDILETVWGYDVYPSTRTIDNYILAFRKYFEHEPKKSRYFHSVRGVGYKFTP